MIRDHETIEELIAIRSLGGLDAGDEAALDAEQAAHGADCVECRRLEAEYDETAGRLAFAVEPVPLRDGFEDEVVRAAMASSTPAGGPVADAPTDAVPSLAERRARRVGAPRWMRPLAAIAAALVLFVGGWVLGGATSGDGGPGIPSDARVVAFQGEAGTLAVAYRPGEKGVYLLGSGLPTPPEGKVYEVWMIQDGTPIAGPCVTPEPDGSLFAFADAELGTTDTMAVTVEPSACSTAPTTDPVFTATIRA